MQAVLRWLPLSILILICCGPARSVGSTTSCRPEERAADSCTNEGGDRDERTIETTSRFQPLEMRQVSIEFNETLSLHVLEATSSFCSSGADDTGLVVWGPSVALSQYLLKHQHKALVGKRVLELGCGVALPSMMAYHLGASEVLATDYRQQTLEQVQFHAKLNHCHIHVELVDWEDPGSCSDFQPDIVLAADVIYGLALVPALVNTIEHVLPKTSTVIIATRDGRIGIPEFRSMMKANFVEHIVEESTDHSYLPAMPRAIFKDTLSQERWNGNHSIFVYQWRDVNESSE